MVRQTRSYLAGAVSSTALVAAAVLAFVVLVSVQVFRGLPVSGLGVGGGGVVSVSRKHAVSDREPARNALGVGPGGGAFAHPSRHGGAARAGRSGTLGQLGGLSSENPRATLPGNRASHGESPSRSGGGSSPTAPSPAPIPDDGRAPPERISGAAPGGREVSPGASIAGTVGSAVSKVQDAVGGTLGDTGVPKAAEGAANTSAGIESTVGRMVGAVDGLLHLDR